MTEEPEPEETEVEQPDEMEETPIDTEETEEEEPIEEAEEEEEDPKDIARAMLIDGEDSETVAEQTGLSIRVVWGIKGALARSGLLGEPTEPPEESKPPSRRTEATTPSEEGLPFEREKTASQLIKEICKKYGVKERAIDIIADRCDRVPGKVLHPADFERMLRSLKTGLQKGEPTLIAEEYDLALRTQEEEARADEERRTYDYSFSRRREREREPGRRGLYPTEGAERREQRGYGYRDYGRREEEPRAEVTMEDLRDMKDDILRGVTERMEKKKEEDRIDKILDTIQEQGRQIDTLKTNVQSMIDNPPVVEAESEGESDYEKTLKLNLEERGKEAKELKEIIREDRKEHKADMKEMAEAHQKNVDRLITSQKTDIKELREFYGKEVDKALKTPKGEYQKDEVRLISDVGGRLVDLAEKRRPIELIIKGLEPKTSEPPQREKVGKSDIVNQIPPNLVE